MWLKINNRSHINDCHLIDVVDLLQCLTVDVKSIFNKKMYKTYCTHVNAKKFCMQTIHRGDAASWPSEYQIPVSSRKCQYCLLYIPIKLWIVNATTNSI